jgi:hypothetical protein
MVNYSPEAKADSIVGAFTRSSQWSVAMALTTSPLLARQARGHFAWAPARVMRLRERRILSDRRSFRETRTRHASSRRSQSIVAKKILCLPSASLAVVLLLLNFGGGGMINCRLAFGSAKASSSVVDVEWVTPTEVKVQPPGWIKTVQLQRSIKCLF